MNALAAAGWRAATLTTWGRARHAHTHVLDAPEADAALAAALTQSKEPLIAYGAGRCYGDASLNDGAGTLLARSRARVHVLDGQAPAIVADAGVSFNDLSTLLQPQGLTYPVASATGAVTLGGALANDIHAKNHTAVGGFGRHVEWFELMLADGRIVHVTRESDPDLWRATVGGLGLTGIILRLRLKLVRMAVPAADVRYRRMRDLDAFLDALEPWPPGDPFWFGWVDALATGRDLGRGILETARYAETDAATAPTPQPRRVPFDLPGFVLHPALIAHYNARRWRTLPEAGIAIRKPIAPFYFPLDHIRDFNRIYGRTGFYSVHCGIPYGNRAGVRAILEEIVRARAGSIASVLKPMGGAGEGFISFPLKGYALAVDLPRRPGVEELYARIERMTLDHGGRLYVAKDALMSAQGFAQMFPELDRFRAVLRRVDPQGRFQSDMSRRLKIRPELG
ncbi:MAG: FAD-binding oxidoreductase [Variibacter sp.]|nr:FAD-binding oxidoreductase [Variibacter sp.]